jgi:hypothetical protein
MPIEAARPVLLAKVDSDHCGMFAVIPEMPSTLSPAKWNQIYRTAVISYSSSLNV